MNQVIILFATVLNRKQILLLILVLLAIFLMPIITVFSFGRGALTFLASRPSGSDSISNISPTEVGLYEGPTVAGDTYAWGNCTYWVYALREEAGDPIPTTWGNAAQWASYAATDGYVVDHLPSVGSIMQTPDSAGGLGHVAYVTAVDPATGRWTISEMNVKGLDVVDVAVYAADYAPRYNFIHDPSLGHD